MRTMARLTDAELIPGLIAKKEEAVALLLDRYWTRAYRVAFQLTNDSGAAEDVAQETFVHALQSVNKLKDPSSFRSWFFGILKNTAKIHHRSTTRRRERERRVAVPSVAVESLPGSSEDEELVREHLAQLPAHYRHALALRYLDGMSLAEVANALDCPEGTVSSRIRRGLRSLKQSLEPTMNLSVVGGLDWLRRALSVEAPSAPAAVEIVTAVGAASDLIDVPKPPVASEVIAQGSKAAVQRSPWLHGIGICGLLGMATIGALSTSWDDSSTELVVQGFDRKLETPLLGDEDASQAEAPKMESKSQTRSAELADSIPTRNETEIAPIESDLNQASAPASVPIANTPPSERFASIRGRVIRDEDSVGIPRAWLRLESTANRRKPGGQWTVSRTKADGSFETSVLLGPGETEVDVIVVAPERRPVRRTLTLTTLDLRDFEVRMIRGGPSLVVRILDDAGKPLPDLAVSAKYRGIPALDTFGLQDDPRGVPRRTNAEGEVRFSGLLLEEIEYKIQAPNGTRIYDEEGRVVPFGQGTAIPQDPQVALTLRCVRKATHSFSVISSEGTPLNGWLQLRSSGGWMEFQVTEGRAHGFLKGKLPFRAEASFYPSSERKEAGIPLARLTDVEIRGDMSRLEFDRRRSAEVVGRVHGTEKPHGVKVGLYALNGSWRGLTTTADQDGQFRFTDLAPGHYSVEVLSDAKQALRGLVSLTLQPATTHTIQLICQAVRIETRRVRLTLRDTLGRSLSGASIEAKWPRHLDPRWDIGSRSATTDAEGVAELGRLPSVATSLSVWRDGYAPRIISIQPGVEDLEREVILDPAGHLVVQVDVERNAAGTLPRDIYGWVTEGDPSDLVHSSHHTNRSRVEANGRANLVFRHVPLGRKLGLHVRAPRQRPEHMELLPSNTWRRMVSLRLPASTGVTITGTVVFADGEAAVGAQIAPLGIDPFRDARAICDGDGQFRVSGLEPGERLSVRGPWLGIWRHAYREVEVPARGGELRVVLPDLTR